MAVYRPVGFDLEEESGFRETLWAIWARRGSVLAVLAVVSGTLLLHFSGQPKIYQSSTEVLVNPLAKKPGGVDIYEAYSNIEPARRVATSDEVKAAAETRLPGIDPATQIVVSAPPGSNTLLFAATSPSPRDAQRAAAVYAHAFLEFRRHDLLQAVRDAAAPLDVRVLDLERQISSTRHSLSVAVEPERTALQTQFNFLLGQRQVLEQQRTDLAAPGDREVGRVLQPAKLPEVPIAPSRLKNLVVALLLGGLLGTGQAYARTQIAPRIQGRPDLAEALGAPAFALIPRGRGRRFGRVRYGGRRSRRAEAYVTLGATLMAELQRRERRTLVVTSANRSECRTVMVANLGAALARAGKWVVLVSADPEAPAWVDVLGPGPSRRESLDQLRLLGYADLGWPADEPMPADIMLRVMDELRREADVVMIDAPPVLGRPETLGVAPLADAVLVVAVADRTTQSNLGEARLRLEAVGAKIVGGVLCDVDRSRILYEQRFEPGRQRRSLVEPPPRPLDDLSIRL